jgi:hypothetical protein
LFSLAPDRRTALFAGMNVLFMAFVAVGCAVGGGANPRVAYLLLLFPLCTVALLYLDSLNGRYSLLAIFSAAYFVMYGMADVAALLGGTTSTAAASILSPPELVILVGGATLIVAYRCMVALADSSAPGAPPRDWSFAVVMLVGAVMWAIGTYATYQWFVHIVTDTTNEAVRHGLQTYGMLDVSISILAQMMQPLGILLIGYGWRKQRSRALLIPVLAMVALQVALGFVADVKGLAMLAGVLMIMTIVLVDAKIPKWWLLGALVFVIVVFPIFQAYRTEIHGNRGIARTAVVQNLGKIFALTLSAEDRVNSGLDRAQTFWERSSLLGSVDMIVTKTGNGVAYQQGHTLTPLIATFIPKILWPDKPDVATGQLVNHEFHVTDGDDVYISPSTLGELYWNFGWTGVIGGMCLIGGILGFVGSRFNLADATTVTRFLVTVITIKQVIMGFEGVIGATYVVWLRSLAGVGLLHALFARIPVPRRNTTPLRRGTDATPGAAVGQIKPFPNLLN